jgi:hypothetical protein
MTIPVTTGSLGLLLSDPGGPDHHKPRGWAADLDTNLQAIDTAVSGLSGGGGALQVARVEVTSAQLLALVETPVVLVAAPGAGKVLVPISVAWQYKFGTAPYDAPGSATVDYSSLAGDISGPGIGSGCLDQSSNQFNFLAIYLNGPNPQSTAENLALVLANEAGSGDFSQGDGTLTVTIAYYVVTLS